MMRIYLDFSPGLAASLLLLEGQKRGGAGRPQSGFGCVASSARRDPSATLCCRRIFPVIGPEKLVNRMSKQRELLRFLLSRLPALFAMIALTKLILPVREKQNLYVPRFGHTSSNLGSN